MSSHVQFGKRAAVVNDILSRVQAGELRSGDQLPSEHELADQFKVSRGTVRSALAELTRRSVIQTQGGVGSFIIFDDVSLDQKAGWTTALLDTSEHIVTEVLRIEQVPPSPEASRHGIRDIILVERRRRGADGTPISVERSFIPMVAALRDLPVSGLVNGSITATLASAAIVATSYRLSIGVKQLDAADAALMERASGDLVLASSRVSLTAGRHFAEHVESLLDPHRFRIECRGLCS